MGTLVQAYNATGYEPLIYDPVIHKAENETLEDHNHQVTTHQQGHVSDAAREDGPHAHIGDNVVFNHTKVTKWSEEEWAPL